MKNNYPWIHMCILIFLSILIRGQSLDAQQLFSIASDEVENDKYSVYWSMGEPVTLTATSTRSNLTQGYHQPSVVLSPCLGCTTSNRDKVLQSKLKIRQNPTIHFLDFELLSSVDKIQQFEIYDLLGNLIITSSDASDKRYASLVVSQYNAGQYFLRVLTTHGSVLTKTFQVMR